MPARCILPGSQNYLVREAFLYLFVILNLDLVAFKAKDDSQSIGILSSVQCWSSPSFDPKEDEGLAALAFVL